MSLDYNTAVKYGAAYRVKEIGLFLPAEAERQASKLLNDPDRFNALPILTQMQVRTYQDRIAISAPQPVEGPRPKAETPSSEQVVLEPYEPGKGAKLKAKLPEKIMSHFKPTPAPGTETVAHNIKTYHDLARDYAQDTGINQALIEQNRDLLKADQGDVEAAAAQYNYLTNELDFISKQIAMMERTGISKKELKKLTDARDKMVKDRQGLLNALNEPEFGKAAKDAQGRTMRAEKAVLDAIDERMVAEYAYTEIQTKFDQINARKSKATKEQKADPTFNSQTAQMERTAADEAKSLAQQAKLSADQVRLRLEQTNADKEYVQKKLDRFPGKIRGLIGKIIGGALGAGISIATLGLVSVKGRTAAGYGGLVKEGEGAGTKGYMGGGGLKGSYLLKGGFPFQFTFLNDLQHQIIQFKNALRIRPTGPGDLDVISAVLRGINEIFLQNIINIAGNIALVSTILTVLLGMAGVATFGATGAGAAVTAAIGTVCGIIVLAAAGLKALIDVARVVIDGLAVRLNKDIGLRNALVARAKMASMETMADVTQAAVAALGTGPLLNRPDIMAPTALMPAQFGPTQVGSLVTTSISIAGTAGKVGAGPVAQGIAGVASPQYERFTASGGSALTAGKGQAKPPTSASSPAGVPGWMQTEMAKQTKIRFEAFKAQLAQAASRMAAIRAKAPEVDKPLLTLTGDVDKIDLSLDDVKGKGAEQVSEEDRKMSKAQKGLLHELSAMAIDKNQALEQFDAELQKMSKEFDAELAERRKEFEKELGAGRK